MSRYWTPEEDAAFLAAADGATAAATVEASASPMGKRTVTFTSAASVRPERVRWVWDKRVPLGCLTVLAGQQGLGKSTLTLELAAQLSRGELEGDLFGVPCSTLVVTLEDHISSVVVPRLRAAGADLERVHIVGVKESGFDGMVSLPGDLRLVEEGAIEHQARLVIVDPIAATLGSETDTHKDSPVRRVLAPLGLMAQRCGLTAVVTMHLSKARSDELLTRISGSVAFTAAARSVLVFARHPDDPDGEEGNERVIVHEKCNVGLRVPTLACTVQSRLVPVPGGEPIETSQLVVTGECLIRGGDLSPRSDDDRGRLDEASDFLNEQLGDGEWHEVKEILAAAKAVQIVRSTLYSARRRVGVESEKGGFPRTAKWRLLPSNPKLSNAVVQTPSWTTANVNSDGAFLAPDAQLSNDPDGWTTGRDDGAPTDTEQPSDSLCELAEHASAIGRLVPETGNGA